MVVVVVVAVESLQTDVKQGGRVRVFKHLDIFIPFSRVASGRKEEMGYGGEPKESVRQEGECDVVLEIETL